jgi:glutamate formiminotransferase
VSEVVEALRNSGPAVVLDVSSDADHNRSVITLAGDDEALFEASMALFAAAIPRIDLREHKGEHPRMGSVDVLPFVPVRGVTMADATSLARRVGEEASRRFGVPIYLYAESATAENRKLLPEIRKGEFEGFPGKIAKPEWKPDFGPQQVHPSAGVTAVGARPFLIAYNINLGTSDLKIAEKIAKAIRASSGGYRFVQAKGIPLEGRGIVQVSMNLLDFRRTPIFRVFETVRSEADRYGVPILGSEIVGLIPQDALLAAAEHYLRIEGFSENLVFETRLDAGP